LHVWRPSDGACLRARTLTSYAELNRLALAASTDPQGVLGAYITLGDRVSIKRCAVGDHCSLAKFAKLAGCVLFEGVVVGERCVARSYVLDTEWTHRSARLDNCILARNVRIGENAVLRDCEVGEGCEVPAGAQLKGEQLSLD
jgi:translation initiation factor eIF-2B subunit gamma